MEYSIESLNEEQKKALFCDDGVVLVTAGAGSGKTRLLTHRICYLIQEKHVDPFNILAITFTNKATNEMKERVASMCPAGVWISTFHSMCVRILRENIHLFSGYDRNFTIVSETDRDRILKELCKAAEVDSDEVSKIEKHLDNIKNKGLDTEEYFNALFQVDHDRKYSIYHRICNGYEEHLRKSNALDFDDLLNKTLQLFSNFPDVLNKYATRFEHVLVDEFQDTNLVQYKLVKKLVSVHGNLFVVGDEDQCIYSWRGANFENIFALKRDFENVHVFKLEQNYRSSKNILTLANNVIQNNRERLKKTLWTDKDGGEMPVIYEAADERDEARYVANEIYERAMRGASFSDFAILMRINALSRQFEESLMAYQIPYKLYGGFKFYERAEVKAALAYFSIFSNQHDEISLLKIINFPKRGIGDAAIATLRAEAGEESILSYLCSERFENSKTKTKLANFVKTFKELKEQQEQVSLSDFCENVLSRFRVFEAYSGTDEENISRRANLDSLLSSVQDFEAETGGSLSDYLSDVMLKTDSDEIQENGYVTLSTVHSVKGLEFDTVFVVGLEEGIFPLSRASLSASEMEEERRLMYVAITRAERKIFITHADRRFMYGKTSYQSKSRFLSELGIVDKNSRGKSKKYEPKTSQKSEEKDVFESDYCVGDKVCHTRLGEGTILEISEDGYVAEIEFQEFGKKSIMLNSKNLEKV